MMIKHAISMDLTRPHVSRPICMTQDDKYSRNLVLTLYNNGIQWEPGTDVTAVVRFVKKDGTGGSYDTLPNGEKAWDIQGNVLTVAVAPQVCTAVGTVELAISLFSGEAVLTTFAMMVDVQAVPGLYPDSKNYYKHSGFLLNTGWASGKYLGTDENGKVVTVDPPAVVEPEIQGGVQSVNGIKPDENGDISISTDGLPVPAVATVGQYLRVSAVDEYGRVIAVEAVDTDAKTPTAYLYNGARVQAMPAVDRVTYPYCYMWMNSSYNLVELVFWPIKLVYDPIGGGLMSTELTDESRVTYARFDNIDNSWGDMYYVDQRVPNMNSTFRLVKPFWANYDVLDTDGNVFLEASDPIPDYTPVYSLYNSTQLYALPTWQVWDQTRYPYGLIQNGTLYFTANPNFSYQEDGSCCMETGGYAPHLSSGWGHPRFKSETITITEPIWSNFDLLREDGSVFLAASEPVPVYPGEETLPGTQSSGMETVTLTTSISSELEEPCPLSVEESTILSAMVEKGEPFLLAVKMDEALDYKTVASVGAMQYGDGVEYLIAWRIGGMDFMMSIDAESGLWTVAMIS